MEMLLSKLYEFAAKFRKMADEFDGTTRRSLELTDIIDDYTGFIMNPRNQEIWEEKDRTARLQGGDAAYSRIKRGIGKVCIHYGKVPRSTLLERE
ncbi:hypothetical protein ACFSQ7_24770 [Paenibacillus rhizoplanae]